MDEWHNVNLIGFVVAIISAVLTAGIVVARDFIQVWDPNSKVAPMPDRQLTSMSAAWAPATMPGNQGVVEVSSNEHSLETVVQKDDSAHPGP
jgi:hypothetical protein